MCDCAMHECNMCEWVNKKYGIEQWMDGKCVSERYVNGWEYVIVWMRKVWLGEWEICDWVNEKGMIWENGKYVIEWEYVIEWMRNVWLGEWVFNVIEWMRNVWFSENVWLDEWEICDWMNEKCVI